MVTINLFQARELYEMFGGEDAEVSVEYFDDGHDGPGLYAWHSDYTSEGSVRLGLSGWVPDDAVEERGLKNGQSLSCLCGVTNGRSRRIDVGVTFCDVCLSFVGGETLAHREAHGAICGCWKRASARNTEVRDG